jgi:hypothetical protein
LVNAVDLLGKEYPADGVRTYVLDGQSLERIQEIRKEDLDERKEYWTQIEVFFFNFNIIYGFSTCMLSIIWTNLYGRIKVP